MLGAGLLGLALERARPGALENANASSTGSPEGGLAATPSNAGRRALRVLAFGLAAWWIPLLGVIAIRGWQDVLSQEAVYFSQAAMVTFGGAYAVLAYVNQAAVGHFGWLLPGQMLDGLALAETTPGPLILVLEFVGFVAAWRHPGGLDPLLAGVLGATVTVWATFAPCFLWIFCLVGQWRFSWGLVPVIAGSAGAGLLRAVLAR